MGKSKLIRRSLVNSLGAAAYIAAVAWLLSNGEGLFGKIVGFWGPFAMLMLLVLSATVVGALILGKPILLYLEGEKQAGIKLFFYSIAWLFGFTIITFFAISQF
jgi:heme O synthase-like polyprenyltransferase